MPRPLRLVHFSPLAEASAAPPDGAEAEPATGPSYEQGYSDGWAEATAAQSAEVATLRGDLGKSLVEMTLTRDQARQHILSALEPLFREMVEKILPKLAHESLGHRIVQELLPMAAEMSETPIIVKTAPECLSAVTQILLTETSLPVRIEAEVGLCSGQAYISRDGAEVRLDLDGVVQTISEAVSGYFQLVAHEGGE